METPLDQDMRTRFETETWRNAVVEAGAGTGKTTLVVARYLALVTGAHGKEPVPIDRIALMTFTEAAAAELKGRVADGLGAARLRALDAGDEALAAKLGEALAGLGAAPISTIHGFTQRILRDHALEAGLDPSFEVLGPIERQRLVEEVFELWFDEVSSRPAVRRGLSFGIGLGAIETLARDLVDLGPAALEVAAPELPELAGQEGLIRATLLKAKDLIERFGAALEDPEAYDLKATDKLVALLRALVELLEDHPTPLEGDASLPELEAFELELMKPRWESGAPYGGNLSPKKWAVAFGGSTDDFKELCKESAAMMVALREAIGARIAVELTAELGSFREHFEVEKARRGVVDFDDLLVLAERLVREDVDVRMRVRERFETIFVDEFQDTDLVQARLVFFLAGEVESLAETDWTKVVPEPGRLVLVGDPKQSIYRFRKADVETYRECCRLVLEADPEARYTITTNFRTDGALVDFVNESFQEGPAKMEAPEGGDWQADYVPLVAFHKRRGSERPVIALVQPEEDALRKSDENLVLEAACVARYLSEALGSSGGESGAGGRPCLVGADGAPLGMGDVAVLARTRATLDAYAEALAAEGIPYVFEGGGKLFKSREVEEALALLTAVVEPGRETAVVGALRSVWIGVSDDALVRHRLEGGAWDPNGVQDEAGDPEVRAGLKRLAELAERARELGPVAFLEEVLEATGLIGLFMLRPSGAQAVMDLVRLRTLLVSLVVDEGLGLLAAVRFAGRLARSGSDETGARLSAKGAVRLMTVHASKGLEFPLVVLAQPSRRKTNEGQDKKPWIDGNELIVDLGKALRHPRHKELMELQKKRAEAELLRQFYVATTRAKHFLLVPVFASVRADAKEPGPVHKRIKQGAFGALLGTAFATGEDYIEHPLVAHVTPSLTGPIERDEGLEAKLAGSLAAELERAATQLRVVEDERPGRLGARSPRGPVAFGPSTVADASAGGEQATAPTDTPGSSPAAGMDGELAARIGTFVHRALELRLGAAEAEDLGVAEGFEREDAAFIGRCVATEAGLESHARAFAPGVRVLDEAPVLWGSLPVGEALLMNGFIDRLILFEDGTVEIVDFKTDRFDAADEEALAAHTDHHMVQLGLYGLALEAAGLQVRQLTLAYLAAGCDDSRPFDDEARSRSLGSLEGFARGSS